MLDLAGRDLGARGFRAMGDGTGPSSGTISSTASRILSRVRSRVVAALLPVGSTSRRPGEFRPNSPGIVSALESPARGQDARLRAWLRADLPRKGLRGRDGAVRQDGAAREDGAPRHEGPRLGGLATQRPGE